ncbi:hypothetical protein [Pseudomonas saxonica]|uniref:hypothetical protein n=1 Tax=Pseudomonas saxonica TaxID=2600598 RepID=UPI002D79BD1F|nr:hypothetical protein [Pseudomonas saxonica]WRQ74745.1 hypothetical protein VQY67_22280 [Pseudomonas saxonica]
MKIGVPLKVHKIWRIEVPDFAIATGKDSDSARHLVAAAEGCDRRRSRRKCWYTEVLDFAIAVQSDVAFGNCYG